MGGGHRSRLEAITTIGNKKRLGTRIYRGVTLWRFALTVGGTGKYVQR